MTITHQDIADERQKIFREEYEFQETAKQSAQLRRAELWTKCPAHIWGNEYGSTENCCVCGSPKP